jgi:CHAT domain-containing protein
MQATSEAFEQLQRTDELDKCDIIHFATHTVLNHMAPSLSTVLLHDSSLTYTDILNLRLRARLVVLASCEGALGHHYAGDEIVGLAQAFFFAGAHTVVASLWPVEDTATAELMRRFYYRLDAGASVAGALCIAQSEMATAGYTPYQWAPFITIGLP